MDKRYQVFVSSTFRDLKEERREVMQALLEMNCIPAGMELFPASDKNAWSLIKTVILKSDYYVVVIGGRYGSVSEDGLSFTEKEYDYAVKAGKPVAPFLHKEPGKIPMEFSEENPRARKRLERFRRRLEGKHTCKYWRTPEDLGGKVSRAIDNLIRDKPSAGWIRGDASAAVASTGKLGSLLKVNERLQAKVRQLSGRLERERVALAQGEDKITINGFYGPRALDGLYVEPDAPKIPSGEAKVSLSWNELLRLVGDLMEYPGQGVLEHKIAIALQELLTENVKPADRRCKQFPGVRVRQHDIRKIAVQLTALGLLRLRDASYGTPLWVLTQQGIRKYTNLVALKGTPHR